jgi:hypothetical protein
VIGFLDIFAINGKNDIPFPETSFEGRTRIINMVNIRQQFYFSFLFMMNAIRL